MVELPTVNGLPLPIALVHLIEQGGLRHPGDEAVSALIPFLCGPVVFLGTVEQIERCSPHVRPDDVLDAELRELSRIEEQELEQAFRMVRGSRAGRTVDLPWLDRDRAVVIAVNREIGDDLMIALDYRTDARDPRVVATDWNQPAGTGGCCWREVTSTFTHFVEALRLAGRDAEPGAAPDPAT